jgi:hypothetical protein
MFVNSHLNTLVYQLQLYVESIFSQTILKEVTLLIFCHQSWCFCNCIKKLRVTKATLVPPRIKSMPFNSRLKILYCN